MAYENLPPYFPVQYSKTFEKLLAQNDHRFGGKYTMCDIAGEKKRINQHEALRARKITGRATDTTVDERVNYARWVTPFKYEITERIDEWDEADLGEILMPTGEIMLDHTSAYNYERDLTCRDALEGNATTGLDGTTLTALPSTQIVDDDFVRTGSTVQSGLTFAKVGRSSRILTANEVEKTGRFAMIGSTEEEDLIQDVAEAKNSGDFGVIPTVPDGMIDGKTWYGYSWTTFESLTTASNITNCLFWQQRQLIFGDGQRKSYTDILPTKSHALQIRDTWRMGAVRREEKGVVIVETYHA